MCEAENAKRFVMVYMASPSGRMLRQIREARSEPIIGGVASGGIAPFATGAAPAAMSLAAIVAGPRFSKRHTKPRTFADDVGFTPAQERRFEIDLPKSFECAALHRA